MAFVNRSERAVSAVNNNNYSQMNQNIPIETTRDDVNDHQTITISNKLLNEKANISRIISSKRPLPPFNTSSNRSVLLNGLPNTPGPGAYWYPKNFIKESFNRNTTSPNDPQVNPFTNEINDKLFISSEPRFLDPDLSKRVNSGRNAPDWNKEWYNKEILSRKSAKPTKYLHEIKKPNLATLTDKRVLSIPTKDSSFGYDVNEDGDWVWQKEPKYLDNSVWDNNSNNNNSNNKKGNEANNNRSSIYKKFGIGVIDWSKSLGAKGDWRINSSKNASTFAQTEPAELTEIERNIPIISNSLINLCLQKRKLKPRLFKNEHRGWQAPDTHKEEIDLDWNLFGEDDARDEVPGPGAYNIPNPYSKLLKPKPEKFQNFGSNSVRGISPLKQERWSDYYHNFINCTEPGLVNRAPVKKAQLPPKKKLAHSIDANWKAKQIYLESKDNTKIGPGLYNPQLVDRRPGSNIGYFNCLEKRFVDAREKDTTPGAGSYLGLKEWVEPSLKYQNKFNREPTKPLIKREDVYLQPSVGSYNPEKYTSIEHCLYSNVNKKNHVASFESNDQRFKMFQINKRTGPGRYNSVSEFDKITKSKKNLFPFNVGGSNHKSIAFSQSNIGPGDYETGSYFDWNKKSYNILFN